MSNAELIAEIERLDATATKDWHVGAFTLSVLFGLNDDGTGIEFDNVGDATFIRESRTLLPLAAERLRECERKLKSKVAGLWEAARLQCWYCRNDFKFLAGDILCHVCIQDDSKRLKACDSRHIRKRIVELENETKGARRSEQM